jgi:c(7)-type cytochrome triheme protein
MIRRVLAVGAVLLLGAAAAIAQAGTPHRMPRPDEYGNVVMNNHVAESKMAPVRFEHWLHRAKYSCRLCHVDLGFAMIANGTNVLETDIRNGYYCGACHDGKTSFASVERTALGGRKENCDRCHSEGRSGIERKYDFRKLTEGFPRARFGNRVDWTQAEELKLIVPVDYLEGHSIWRAQLQRPADRELDAKVEEMPDILLSHDKHAAWSGCELCHPQFFGVRKASNVYHMQDIFAGKHCGACHGNVAFPTADCQLCHTKPVS